MPKFPTSIGVSFQNSLQTKIERFLFNSLHLSSVLVCKSSFSKQNIFSKYTCNRSKLKARIRSIESDGNIFQCIEYWSQSRNKNKNRFSRVPILTEFHFFVVAYCRLNSILNRLYLLSICWKLDPSNRSHLLDI